MLAHYVHTLSTSSRRRPGPILPELSIWRRCWSDPLAITTTFGGYGSPPAWGRHRRSSERLASPQIPDSIFKQPRVIALAPCASCVVSCAPRIRGAWSAARRKCVVSFPFATRETRRLTALHSRRFWARGACFRDRTGATRASIRLAFAGLHPVRVQPLKAEPRSWPGR